jgi:hypothetical protein
MSSLLEVVVSEKEVMSPISRKRDSGQPMSPGARSNPSRAGRNDAEPSLPSPPQQGARPQEAPGATAKTTGPSEE